ncbi:MAG TPA: NnrU family protein [Steroidobacteraceae bacterium]|nr:NnrU family protein [Steroidobacteraceae bacterium]
MGILILGLAIFLGMHSLVIISPELRTRAVQRFGEGVWKSLHGLISLIGLALIIQGFGLARQAPIALYTPPGYLRLAAFLFMLPVFPLIIAAYLPGRIKTAMRFPLLVAVKCWAFAHLLANGGLADVLLFGGFLAWAVLDRISLKRRPPLAVRTVPAGPLNDVIAVLLGLAVYALFIGWVHQRLFGVSPLG